jgi:hypothetical protein
MENLSKLHNKETLQFGLISALASIVIFVVIYVMGAKYFMSPMVWVSSYVLPIVFAVWGGIAAKRKSEGFLAYREALKVTFGVLVITGFLSTVFSYFIFNVLDVAFAESVKQLSIEKTMEFMQNFKVPETEIDKAIDEMIKQDMFSAGSLLKSYAYACILYFIEALIIAAIIKKKKPEVPF